MTWRRWELVLACVALLAWGAARAAPPMWRVAGAKGTAVLFGSIHLLPAGVQWRSTDLTDAVSRADELWFEIPLGGDNDARAARLLEDRGSLPRGDALAKHLTPAMLARLNGDAVRLGLAPETLARMRPWLADATLSITADIRSGALASEGVERRIDALAPASVRRRALESAADQIAVLADGSMVEQIDLLSVTLDEVEREPDAYKALVDAWIAGDIPRLKTEALEPLAAASPRAYAALLTTRNRRWAKEIRRRLRRRGDIVVVVGVGHLLGPGSLPALLRAAGLAVEGPPD